MEATEPANEDLTMRFIAGWKQSLANKVFVPGLMKPVVKVLAVRTSRGHLWSRMNGLLFFGEETGWVVMSRNKKNYTMTCREPGLFLPLALVG